MSGGCSKPSGSGDLRVALKDELGVPISEANPLEVITRPIGMLDTNNSTTTPLAAGAKFTGIATDISEFVSIALTVDSDQVSTTDGLKLYFSADGVSNWLLGEEYTYLDDGDVKHFTPPPWSVFYRIEYTNGAVDQTRFNLVSVIRTSQIKPSSHNIEKPIKGGDDAELVKAVLTGLAPDGGYKNVLVTNAGNQKISVEEFDPALYDDPLPVDDPYFQISQGLRTGMYPVNKYGLARNGVQTTDTDIWDRADSLATQQIWLAPTAARIHTIVSTSAADDGTPEGVGAGAQAVDVYYLPTWDLPEAVETVILNGLTGVPMINSAVIIHRMRVVPVGTTYRLNVGNITATAAVDGTITAQVTAGEGSTLMAIYGIPSTQTAYMTYHITNAHTAANPATDVEADFSLLINSYPHLNTTAFVNHGNIGIRTSGTTSPDRTFKPPKKIAGPAIIKFQAIASAVDIDGTAEFDLVLVDN